VKEPSERTLALLLGTLTAFAPLSIDMYLPSLPAIARDLHASASAVQLTLAAFFAGLAVAQLAYGPLADRFGRKPPLVFGLVLYVLASVACALAPTVEILVAMRFVQAVGGAAGVVVARAVVRDLRSGAEAARLLSLLMLVMGAAPVLAPLLGSALSVFGSWRLTFWVLAVLGVVCLAVVPAALPETGRRRASRGAPSALLAEIRALLGDRSFLAFALAGGFSQAGMFAYIAGSPFVLIELFDVPPRTYALLFGLNAAGLIAASQLNRRVLATHSSVAVLGRATMAAFVAGLALVALAFVQPSLAPSLVALFVFVATIGFVGPNTTALAMERHGARAGLASAVLGSLQFTIASAAATLVGAANDGTMRPMATVMAGCGAAGVACMLLGRKSLAPEAVATS